MQLTHIQVFGKVQGVYFRQSTRIKAIELGIKGFVRNEEDGSVYIEALCEADQLAALISWCYEGPPHAEVERVSHTYGETHTNFEGFEIKYQS